MASRFLPAVIDNALDDTRTLLPKLLRGQARSRHVLALCDSFRTAGIGSLFLTGTSEAFLHHLHQSGRAFAHYLRNAGNAEVRLSRSRPLFDALCANDFDGAALIARHARRDWAQGEEYEEDFLFPEFLIQYGVEKAPAATCDDLLARYERALKGAEDLRLDVCRALLQADADAFNEALALFLTDRKDQLEKQAETSTFPEEFLATEWSFSLEGLALVRLADRQGLETEEDYLHIPSIAREPGPSRWSDDAWTQLD